MPALDLTQLGVASIIVAILIWQNYELRKSNKEERDYSKQLSESYTRASLQVLETLKNLEQAIVLLRDSLK